MYVLNMVLSCSQVRGVFVDYGKINGAKHSVYIILCVMLGEGCNVSEYIDRGRVTLLDKS